MTTQQRKQYSVLLIGDSCQDVYHYGTCDRISSEAPVPVLREVRQEVRGGMGYNVESNLQALGVEVDFITHPEVIRKHRFVDMRTRSQLLRVDEGETCQVEPLAEDALSDKSYDAIVISDYDKGFITSAVAAALTQRFRAVPVFVDTKKEDLSCFPHSTIKLNEKEYKACHHLDSTSEAIVTLGGEGAKYQGIVYPTSEVEVYDVCGAGDVFLAALVFSFLEAEDMVRAIAYANKLASLSVTKFGTHVLTRGEISGICI